MHQAVTQISCTPAPNKSLKGHILLSKLAKKVSFSTHLTVAAAWDGFWGGKFDHILNHIKEPNSLTNWAFSSVAWKDYSFSNKHKDEPNIQKFNKMRKTIPSEIKSWNPLQVTSEQHWQQFIEDSHRTKVIGTKGPTLYYASEVSIKMRTSITISFEIDQPIYQAFPYDFSSQTID